MFEQLQITWEMSWNMLISTSRTFHFHYTTLQPPSHRSNTLEDWRIVALASQRSTNLAGVASCCIMLHLSCCYMLFMKALKVRELSAKSWKNWKLPANKTPVVRKGDEAQYDVVRSAVLANPSICGEGTPSKLVVPSLCLVWCWSCETSAKMLIILQYRENMNKQCLAR